MTGSFSTALSAAAGAAAGDELCAEALAAARAGSRKPRSLREYFIDASCRRRGRFKHYTPGKRGIVPETLARRQALYVINVKIAELAPQSFARDGTVIGEFHIPARARIELRPLRHSGAVRVS